jgi:hypothetical protein
VTLTRLDLAFHQLAKGFLARHPEVPHEWRLIRDDRSGDRTDLICGRDTPDEVFASLLGTQIACGPTHGEHVDFETFGRDLTDEQVAEEAFDHFVHALRDRGHVRD